MFENKFYSCKTQYEFIISHICVGIHAFGVIVNANNRISTEDLKKNGNYFNYNTSIFFNKANIFF